MSGSGGGSLSDYDVICDIGTGSYGTCSKIRRRRDGAILVWKELSYVAMTEAEKRYLCSEVNLLKNLSHPNIVKYVDRIHDRSSGKVYIIMEYCEGGDLLKKIRAHRENKTSIPEPQIWKWVTQLSLALRCCHCRQGVKAVLHRDLKPANCFLDSAGNLKLGDFGLARVLRDSASFASTFVGTPYYMSPEQMQKSAYTEKSDIWSLGIVAYELTCLRPPFVADRQRDLASRIRRGEFEPPPDSYSLALRSLISDCLNVRPEQRPSVEDLLNRPEMLHYQALKDTDSSPEVSLQSWEDSLARRESAARLAMAELDKARAQLKSVETRQRARDRELAEKEARLIARERLLADSERALASGQARLRFEQLRVGEAVARNTANTQRWMQNVSTNTDEVFESKHKCMCQQQRQQQDHEQCLPASNSQPSIGIDQTATASYENIDLNNSRLSPINKLRSGVNEKPIQFVAIATPSLLGTAVARPIPAPRRSVLRNRENRNN